MVFNYSIEQMSVLYSHGQQENILELLIHLLAIVGGVFTVTKVCDSVIYRTSKALLKADINKLH